MPEQDTDSKGKLVAQFESAKAPPAKTGTQRIGTLITPKNSARNRCQVTTHSCEWWSLPVRWSLGQFRVLASIGFRLHVGVSAHYGYLIWRPFGVLY